MEPLLAKSGFLAIDWADVGKSIRAGALAGAGAFVAGVAGVLPSVSLTEAMQNPKAIISVLVLAGLTAVFDLIRRALTDYSKL